MEVEQSSLFGCFSCIRDLANGSGSIVGNFGHGTWVRHNSLSLNSTFSTIVLHSGSIIAVLGLPLTVLVSRREIDRVRCPPISDVG